MSSERAHLTFPNLNKSRPRSGMSRFRDPNVLWSIPWQKLVFLFFFFIFYPCIHSSWKHDDNCQWFKLDCLLSKIDTSFFHYDFVSNKRSFYGGRTVRGAAIESFSIVSRSLIANMTLFNSIIYFKKSEEYFK